MQRLHRHWLKDSQVRENDLRVILKQLLVDVKTAADDAFSQAHDIYATEPSRLKLVTGEATGIDQMAAELAHESGYELSTLVAQEVRQTEAADESDGHPRPQEADHKVVLGMSASITNQPLTQDDYSLRDDIALSFSDLLIAVWDTQEPVIILAERHVSFRLRSCGANLFCWLSWIQPRISLSC